MVPFLLFCYESSLTYVQCNAHYFTDTAHGFPQSCKIWAKNWILKTILLSGIIVTMAIMVVPMAHFCFFYHYAFLLTCGSQCTQLRWYRRGIPTMMQIIGWTWDWNMVWVVSMVPFWLSLWNPIDLLCASQCALLTLSRTNEIHYTYCVGLKELGCQSQTGLGCLQTFPTEVPAEFHSSRRGLSLRLRVCKCRSFNPSKSVLHCLEPRNRRSNRNPRSCYVYAMK